MKRYSLLVLSFTGMLLIPSIGLGQSSDQRLELDRKGETIILEPYAPNILRVTLSLQRDNALAKPGYGFVGTPNAEGWSKTQTDLNDVYQSSASSPPSSATILRCTHHCKPNSTSRNISTARLPARTSPSPRPKARSF